MTRLSASERRSISKIQPCETRWRPCELFGNVMRRWDVMSPARPCDEVDGDVEISTQKLHMRFTMDSLSEHVLAFKCAQWSSIQIS